ncbi:MAG: ABC transporter ATP-binding protein [Candidatus Thorarchaeota archaeon]
MTMIEIKNVTKRYKTGENVIHALNDVSMSFDQGDSIAITGPSGSGKTTLLSLVGALDMPTTGDIIVEGKSIAQLGDREATVYRRNKVGFIFQMHNLISYLTAFENIELPLVASGVKSTIRIDKVNSLLKSVDLPNRSTHLPGELSGGERQRVALARALVNNPIVVLADEPTGQLDSKTGLMVVELMQQLVRENKGILIMATHDLAMGQHMDREVQLRDGKTI